MTSIINYYTCYQRAYALFHKKLFCKILKLRLTKFFKHSKNTSHGASEQATQACYIQLDTTSQQIIEILYCVNVINVECGIMNIVANHGLIES